MSLNFCDLLVIGSDLSGLMTATLLAKRGLNVLVLDDDEEGTLEPNVIAGLGSRGFKSLLGKLMIPDSKLQILHENRVSAQVVFPKNRLDLPTAREGFLKEIDREFPKNRDNIRELLAEIDHLRENYLSELLAFFPIVDSKEKRKFVSWFKVFPQEKAVSLWEMLSPPLQQCLRLYFKFLTQSPPMEPLILQLLLFLPPEEGATFSVRGGLRGLKRLFYDKLDYFGGMVHPLNKETFEVLTKGSEVKGIQLSRYNFPTRCRYLLGNTDVKSLYDKLPSSFFSLFTGQTKKKVEEMEPVEEKTLIGYQVASEVLPVPLKENVIYVSDPTGALEGPNYLEINLTPLSKPSEGFDTLMTIRCNVKNEPNDATLEEVDRKLHKLLPFSNSHLRRLYPKPAVQNEPAQELELFPSASPGGTAPKKISYSPSLFFPSLESPYKNLFVLGPNVLEWLGMEGKMRAALRAVDLIWSRELKLRKT